MKKTIVSLMSSLAVFVTAANVISCTPTMKVGVDKFYDDRTELQIANQKEIDDQINNGLKFSRSENEKKVILVGLDGMAYDKVSQVLLDGVNPSYTKRYSIQNYESFYGWNSIIYGNIFANTKDKTATSIFDNVEQAGGTSNATISPWMDEFLTERNSTKASGLYDVGSKEDTESCPVFATAPAIEKIVNKRLPKIKDVVATGQWDFLFDYEVLADDCGHNYFGYDSSVVQTAISGYNKILKYYFDNSIFDPSQYLVIMVTDHGRNPDGFSHTYENESAHQSFVLANQDLDVVMNNGEDNSNVGFSNFYDLKETIFNWLKGSGVDEI